MQAAYRERAEVGRKGAIEHSFKRIPILGNNWCLTSSVLSSFNVIPECEAAWWRVREILWELDLLGELTHLGQLSLEAFSGSFGLQLSGFPGCFQSNCVHWSLTKETDIKVVQKEECLVPLSISSKECLDCQVSIVSSLHAFIYKMFETSLFAIQSLGNYSCTGVNIPTGKKIRAGFSRAVLIEVCTAYSHWRIPDRVFHSGLPKYNLDSQFVL